VGDPLHDVRGVASLRRCGVLFTCFWGGERRTRRILKFSKDPKLVGDPLHDVRGVASLRRCGVLFTCFGGANGVPYERRNNPRIHSLMT